MKTDTTQPKKAARPKTRWGALGIFGALGLSLTAGLAPAAQAQNDDTRTPDVLSAKCDQFLLAQLQADHATWGGRSQTGAPVAFKEKDKDKKNTSTTTVTYTSVVVRLSTPLTAQMQTQIQSLGGQFVESLPMINAVALRIPTAWLTYLAALPFVQRLSSDVLVLRSDATTVGESGADTAYANYGVTGQGVTVAVLDSGLRYSGKDLSDPTTGASRVLTNVSFVQNDFTTDDACGHGTHVAGIIAGNGADSGAFSSSPATAKKAILGIARKANLVNVRVLDANGQGDVFSILGGIQWVLNNQKQYNIRVINLSLGHPVGESYTTDPLCQAVEAAWKAGIVVVCAAGNNGRVQNTSPVATAGLSNEGYGANYGSILSPANDPSVITVGAMKTVDSKRTDDRIATYSSRGPTLGDHILKPDLVAPGNLITSLRAVGSTLDVTYPGNVNANPAYFTLSGTSMAAPVVSGAAALLLQKYPTLTPDTVKARLMISADKWTDTVGNGTAMAYGAGYLDIPAALACSVTPTNAAVSPSLTEDLLGDVLVNSAVASAHVVWGTTITGGTNVLWGSNVLWGTNVLWGSNVIWGSNVVWGANITSDANVVWGSNFTGTNMLFESTGDCVLYGSTDDKSKGD